MSYQMPVFDTDAIPLIERAALGRLNVNNGINLSAGPDSTPFKNSVHSTK
jgi:hypothetical protein